MTARLIPELEVEDLDRSLAFYTGIIDCTELSRGRRSASPFWSSRVRI